MLTWLKQVFNADKYNDASIRVLDNMGPGNSSYPPFNYNVAVRSFRSWVYAASWINASAVAATPLRLYMRKDASRKSIWNTRAVTKSRRQYLMGDNAGDVRPSQTVMRKVMDMGDQMEEVTEAHPIIDLLQKANHVYNGFDLTLLRTLYQELTGNAYMHVILDPQMGVPSELWPMPSQWVQVVPDRDMFVAGYTYGRTEVEQLHFDRDEVVHFKRPNPDNLFYGMGKVEAAYGVVKANEAVHDMDLATFENHARPDYAVVVNGPHRRADLDVFEQHVTERLRGTRKAGQFLAVSGDVNFTPLNFPPKDLGGREEIVEEIAAVFGVPVSMMKANDPNLASARAGFSQWRESTILPMLRMDEDVLNQVLLPMFGIDGDACLAYDNPVPADSAFELQQRQTAVAGGWMTLNEARLEQGLSASENPLADELLSGGRPLGEEAQASPFGMGQLSEAASGSDEIQDKYDIDAMKSVLKGVGSGELSAHAGIALCKKIGMREKEATEAVLSQVRIAQDMRRTKAVEPTHLDVYETAEEAAERAEEMGCSGFHMHETEEGQTVFMPCSQMEDYTELTGLEHEKAIASPETVEEGPPNMGVPYKQRIRMHLDLNSDGVVDQADLIVLAEAFGTEGPIGDLNGDGIVDEADLMLWQQYSNAYSGFDESEEETYEKLVQVLAELANDLDRPAFVDKVALQFAGVATLIVGREHNLHNRVVEAINAQRPEAEKIKPGTVRTSPGEEP